MKSRKSFSSSLYPLAIKHCKVILKVYINGISKPIEKVEVTPLQEDIIDRLTANDIATI